MKILLSAFSCKPNRGSEPFVGWSAAVALAKQHDVWILTHVSGERVVAEAQQQGAISPGARFVFLGKRFDYHPNGFVSRMQTWHHYNAWNRSLLAAAKRLHAKTGFDLVHHVTYASWRASSSLDALGIPFIWGPIGGGESIQSSFFPLLSPGGRSFETARRVSNQLSMLSASARQTARRAAHIFVANMETERTVVRLRGTNNGVSRLCQISFTESHLNRFGRLQPRKLYDGPLKLFCGGTLEAGKGIPLALHALAKLKQDGIKFEYVVAGWGPERPYLEKLSARLGLNESVRFQDALTGENYPNQLAQTHVFLLPSLRDSAGATLMEAMLAGCVPVVVKAGGPGEIVNEACGVRISPKSPGYVIDEIVLAVRELNADRQRLAAMGEQASARIRDEFSVNHYLETIDSIYQKVVH
jgi:glycosyltransferase involved in cell wall biosynthesis